MSSKAKSNEVNTEVITNQDPYGFLGEADNLPDDSGLWGSKYPVIQWHNPSKMWEFPMKHWAGTMIEANYPTVEVDHNTSTEASALIDTIHIVVIAWRTAWEHKGDDGKMIYAAEPVQGEKWTKRYKFLALVKETEGDELAIISMGGYTGQYFQGGYDQARKRTQKMARQASGKTFPSYCFWVPMAAGSKIMAGKKDKSAIYPPAPVIEEISEMDDEGTANLLKALYVGHRLKETIGSYLFDEGQRWDGDFPAQLTQAQLAAPAQAVILPGGVLHLPDLSDQSPAEWIKLGLSIEGLFNHPSHASNAFAETLRKRGLRNDTLPNQWEAWRTELEQRYADYIDRESSIATERMLQAGG